MSNHNKVKKIEFLPGSFDNFEGTQEELDALIEEIRLMFKDKTLEELEIMAEDLLGDTYSQSLSNRTLH